MDDHGHREREHFFGAAKVIAVITAVSRVFGLLRDMAITSLGASRATGAFVFAFQIPNLFRRLFGEGALAGAFVPVLTGTEESQGHAIASRLLANTLGLLAGFLLALMVLVQLVLLIWVVLAPGGWDRQLLLLLTAIMLPFMVTVCLLALGSAALNCRGHFAYPAAAPIILNIVIIIAARVVAPWWSGNVHAQLQVVAGSVTVAGVIQLAAVLWLLRRAGFAIRPRLRPVEPGIGPMLRLMAPMLIGLGFLSISPLVDNVIIWVLTATAERPTIVLFGRELARPLAEATQVRVYAARMLYQLPMGVLAVSLGVAVFPLLSRYAARGDHDSLRGGLNRAIRLTLMAGLAAGTGLWMLAEPIMAMLFVRGKFTAADAAGSAFVLKMYSLGMWAYCSYMIFSRAFFALKQPRTPMIVSCVLVVVNMVLVALLVWFRPLGAGAFGLASSMTATVNVVMLAVALRTRLGRMGGRKIAACVARTVACCAAMAAAIGVVRVLMGSVADWVTVAVCVPLGSATFVWMAWVLRAPELRELLGAIRTRRGDDAPPPADGTYNEQDGEGV